MTDATKETKQLRIWQQNCNKSIYAQADVQRSLDTGDFNLAVIQEPYMDFLDLTRTTAGWRVIYPHRHRLEPKRTRSVILVGTSLSTNNWTKLDVDSSDVSAIEIRGDFGHLHIFNIYCDGASDHALDAIEHFQLSQPPRAANAPNLHTVWMGDFNRHHPLWDEERNNHLFTSTNLRAAQTLIDKLAERSMRMVLPHGVPTLEAHNTKNHTRPDNVFATEGFMDAFVECHTLPESRPPKTDHMPIISIIDINVEQSVPEQRRNFQATDWPKFQVYVRGVGGPADANRA